MIKYSIDLQLLILFTNFTQFELPVVCVLPNCLQSLQIKPSKMSKNLDEILFMHWFYVRSRFHTRIRKVSYRKKRVSHCFSRGSVSKKTQYTTTFVKAGHHRSVSEAPLMAG